MSPEFVKKCHFFLNNASIITHTPYKTVSSSNALFLLNNFAA